MSVAVVPFTFLFFLTRQSVYFFLIVYEKSNVVALATNAHN